MVCLIFKMKCKASLIESYVITGKVEFDPDEDAHVIGDCVKVRLQSG